MKADSEWYQCDISRWEQGVSRQVTGLDNICFFRSDLTNKKTWNLWLWEELACLDWPSVLKFRGTSGQCWSTLRWNDLVLVRSQDCAPSAEISTEIFLEIICNPFYLSTNIWKFWELNKIVTSLWCSKRSSIALGWQLKQHSLDIIAYHRIKHICIDDTCGLPCLLFIDPIWDFLLRQWWGLERLSYVFHWFTTRATGSPCFSLNWNTWE